MVLIVNLFIQICRCHLDWPSKPSLNLVQLQGLRLHSKKWGLAAMSKKINNSENSSVEAAIEEEVVVKKKTSRTSKRTPKKTIADSDASSDEDVSSASSEEPKKTRGRTRRKGMQDTIPLLIFLACYVYTMLHVLNR